MILKTALIETPLGQMTAIASDEALYLLEFSDSKKLARKESRLAHAILGSNLVIESITQELSLYFAGQLKEFKTPLNLTGTPFQKSVWKALMTIPYARTISYAYLAEQIGRPTSFRAVAQANGSNLLAVIIPCHRVINKNGALGGYSGGVCKKERLLAHENGFGI